MLYISHLDLAKCVSRAIVKSGLPVWYTEGFNPIPHLVFSPPLSVGCGGSNEVLDFKIVTEVSDEEIFEKLGAAMPDGIEVVGVYTQDMKLKTVTWAECEITFHLDETDSAKANGKYTSIDGMFDAAMKTFGLAAIGRAAVCEKDVEDIKRVAREYIPQFLEGKKTFKVEGKRSDKTFPLNSMELS